MSYFTAELEAATPAKPCLQNVEVRQVISHRTVRVLVQHSAVHADSVHGELTFVNTTVIRYYTAKLLDLSAGIPTVASQLHS